MLYSKIILVVKKVWIIHSRLHLQRVCTTPIFHRHHCYYRYDAYHFQGFFLELKIYKTLF